MLWVIVAAGGSGTRLGGTPKQFRALGDKPVLAWSVVAMLSYPASVVVAANDTELAAVSLSRDVRDSVTIVAGGAERRDSVAAALEVIPRSARYIGVHDAARPLATDRLIDAGLAALDSADAAVPALPLTDTVKRIDADGTVVETLDRRSLMAVQTPQLFRAEALRDAHANYDGDVTDDASMVEARGGTVVTFAGDVRNIKITYEFDFRIAETVLR